MSLAPDDLDAGARLEYAGRTDPERCSWRMERNPPTRGRLFEQPFTKSVGCKTAPIGTTQSAAKSTHIVLDRRHAQTEFGSNLLVRLPLDYSAEDLLFPL